MGLIDFGVKWLMRLCYGAGGVAGVAVALLYFFQEKILYVPTIPGMPDFSNITPERYGMASQDVDIVTKDGIKIHAWLLRLKQWTAEELKSRPVILFFQENAGPMAFRLPFLKLMIRHLGCPVFAVSYRGYRLSEGQLSEGKPTEKGLKEDARAALAHLAQNPAVDGSRVVVFGRSLGGAVALHLAAEKPRQVIGVMVENTFTSVEDMVSRVVPPLGLIIGTGKPGNFLVTNKWRNNEAIGQLDNVPLLMLVSGQDEMVPSEQMYSLHKLQRSKQCKLVEFPLSSHMDAYDKEPVQYWNALTEFMDQFK
ncbi:Alpha/Beta hydrolase protein [Dunaliella salina]|uniref:Alpha/Beta hydrolase protein n=1 Tax=Dunaliella salina TaxID=3046 RepID=A0ABQ7GLC8_DUNSA|nr:Alpha/Beta hydrolase protein [Dunaliella salina]|eukprot:KAF5835417.1 Alpha/Beta hydrolase protein [Dunaliella salina]